MSKSLGLFNRCFPSWPPVAFLTALTFSIVVSFSGVRLNAQVENGINGTVMDTTGAVIAGAHVTITNIATGAISRTVTSSAGAFTVVGLSPGDHTVVVEAPEFKTVNTVLSVEVAKMSDG